MKNFNTFFFSFSMHRFCTTRVTYCMLRCCCLNCVLNWICKRCCILCVPTLKNGHILPGTPTSHHVKRVPGREVWSQRPLVVNSPANYKRHSSTPLHNSKIALYTRTDYKLRLIVWCSLSFCWSPLFFFSSCSPYWYLGSKHACRNYSVISHSASKKKEG